MVLDYLVEDRLLGPVPLIAERSCAAFAGPTAAHRAPTTRRSAIVSDR
jgi:hypothetical protein